MELFDLYDVNRAKTGETMERGTKVPEGRFRLVVHVIIFNSDGKMLIQQRASQKQTDANKWDFSAAGSVDAGETSAEGAKRELFEELGITHDFNGVLPNFTINFSVGFNDFYIIQLDANEKDFILQEDEVQAVRWESKENILTMIRNGEFVKYRESLIDLLFEFRDKKYGIQQ